MSFLQSYHKKSFLNDSPVFSELQLQNKSLNHSVVVIAVSIFLSINVKLSSMPWPVRSPSNQFQKIRPFSTQPPRYFQHVFKIL